MPSSVPEQPSPPADATFLLRLESEQALPPPASFTWTPAIIVTLDGAVLTQGAVPAIFPGPLVTPFVQRQLTSAGWSRIVADARQAGLLSGVSSIGQPVPGGAIVRLRLVADGRTYDVTTSGTAGGCLTDPCQGDPGSHEAFIWFAQRVTDLASWLGTDIGEEAPYLPSGYAVLVGAVPAAEGLQQPAIEWPLAGGFQGFGEPFADGSGFRCGTVTGADADALRGLFATATQITRWLDPSDGSLHGLTVKPLLPGDGDSCHGLV